MLHANCWICFFFFKSSLSFIYNAVLITVKCYVYTYTGITVMYKLERDLLVQIMATRVYVNVWIVIGPST